MKQDKYVRFDPEIMKNGTLFPGRIDINNNGKYEAQHRISLFFNMLFCFVLGGILHLFFRTKKSR